jgi:uncharacterized protein with HEPN domain
MSDEELIMVLQQIEQSLHTIIERSLPVASANDFVISSDGAMRLDSICMQLVIVGEAVKNLDKISNKTLLPSYTSINWRGVMGLRDIIAHQYFNVDEDMIFDIVKNKIPDLLTVIKQILTDRQG